MLGAWRATPARVREDANAEEDLAAGAYRDRLVWELAANAADAAARARAPGHLLLRLAEGHLDAVNSGAPLDAAGALALCTLRSSGKEAAPGGLPAEADVDAVPTREGVTADVVGRFGVGFSAVLAVSDVPSLRSTTGGLAWSAETTRQALAAEGLRDAAALPRVPVLRLPGPLPPLAHAREDDPAGNRDDRWTAAWTEDEPPATVVRLPLRDADAADRVRALLAPLTDAGDVLLLALPALRSVRVEVDGRTVRWEVRGSGDRREARRAGAATTGRRWAVATRAGRHPRALLAGRPVEERDRRDWRCTAAVPVDADDRPLPLPAAAAPVVHAPTPTDEPQTLPVLLGASLPLDRDRRRSAPGLVRDAVLAAAAATVADLVAALPPSADLLDLVPVGLPDGQVDSHLRTELREALGEVPLLAPAVPREDGSPDARGTSPGGVLPRDAVALDLGAASGPAADALAGAVAGLLAPEVAARRAPLAVLSVARWTTRDVVEAVAGLDRPPAWWGRLYRALADAPDLDALAALPVPLADGTTATGARGLLLPPAGEGLVADLPVLGLRAVHPAATAPLLDRLGAVATVPEALLASPSVQGAAAAAWDADDDAADAVAAAVLALVAAAGPPPAGALPAWTSDLPLRDADDERAAAGELVVPGSRAAAVLDLEAGPALVAPDLVQAWGAEVLHAVGCLSTLAVLEAVDVPADSSGASDLLLDGGREWLADVGRGATGPHGEPPLLPVVRAVRDLELVRPSAWDDALRLLAEPGLLDVVVEPVRRVPVDRPAEPCRSYTAWWLRGRPVVPTPDGLRRPGRVAAPGADAEVAALLPPAPAWLGEGLAAALGCPARAADLLDDPALLLDLLADADVPVGRTLLRRLGAGLALLDEPPRRLPDRVRAVVGDQMAVVDAGEAVVVDRPDLLPLLGDRPVVPCPAALAPGLADVLDLALASEVVRPPPPPDGPRTPWGEVPGVPAACDLLGVAVPEGHVVLLPAVPVPGAAAGLPWWAGADEDGAADPDGAVDGGVDRDGRVDAVVVAPDGTRPGLARALAWRVDRWDRRDTVAAVLGEPPAAGAALLAEEDLSGAAP